MKISDSAEKIYRFLSERAASGISPSVREIGAALSIPSTSTVCKRLHELCDAGLIEMEKNAKRSIRIVGIEPVSLVPLVGTIAAGSPILAAETIEGYIPTSAQLGSGEELFALRVKGESMINAGILDGDVVIIRRTSSAQNGEIIAALADDSATVKRFFRENGHFRLQPENDTMEPIILSEVSVLGKVVALYREF